MPETIHPVSNAFGLPGLQSPLCSGALARFALTAEQVHSRRKAGESVLTCGGERRACCDPAEV